uniref:Uncharacterized protein n=2 Tax=Arundo donax TaxID=35708 RepID=A0A0A9DAP9_ARUDO
MQTNHHDWMAERQRVILKFTKFVDLVCTCKILFLGMTNCITISIQKFLQRGGSLSGTRQVSTFKKITCLVEWGTNSKFLLNLVHATPSMYSICKPQVVTTLLTSRLVAGEQAQQVISSI